MIDLVQTVGTHLPRGLARLFPDVLWRRPGPERIAYFTFDDGPTPALTAPLLDTLARFEAKASFFLLGEQSARYPALVRAIDDGGHTIGNHTYSHPDAWNTPAALVRDELERTTTLLEDQLQRPLQWMRPPYGRFTRAMRRWCRQHGQRCTMWDLGPGDYLASATPQKIEQRILRAVRPGSIIVLHDNPKSSEVTPQALASCLHRLREEGWRFAAL